MLKKRSEAMLTWLRRERVDLCGERAARTSSSSSSPFDDPIANAAALETGRTCVRPSAARVRWRIHAFAACAAEENGASQYISACLPNATLLAYESMPRASKDFIVSSTAAAILSLYAGSKAAGRD